MSKVSTVYDKVLEVIPVLFPSKIRFPNAFEPEDNPEPFIRDGWGLRVDGQGFQESEFSEIETIKTFAVVLTKEVIKTDSQSTQIDVAKKSLLEDVFTLQKEFFQIDRLGIPTSLARVTVGGASPIVELRTGKSSFLSVDVFFDFYIRENL